MNRIVSKMPVMLEVGWRVACYLYTLVTEPLLLTMSPCQPCSILTSELNIHQYVEQFIAWKYQMEICLVMSTAFFSFFIKYH